MKLKYEGGRILIVPETAAEGVHVGQFFGELPEQPKAACWINGAQEHLGVDVIQLNIVDDLLEWKGTGLGRVDRIKQLLEREEELDRLKLASMARPPVSIVPLAVSGEYPGAP